MLLKFWINKKDSYALILVMAMIGLYFGYSLLERNISTEGNGYKMNINIDGKKYSVSLEDNETVKELILRLPLELEMNELNGNEKYYYLDESLPASLERVSRIKKGDIMLYGDDCLVIFYESFNTPYSYTRIGRIDNPDDLNLGSGKVSVLLSE